MVAEGVTLTDDTAVNRGLGWARVAAHAGSLVAATVGAVLGYQLRESFTQRGAWTKAQAGTKTGAAARAATATTRWAQRIAAAHRLRVELKGTPPPPGAGVLVVANHVSYLDIVATAATTEAAFLGMIEIASWPLLGWAARSAGMVFVERGKGMSGATALRQLGHLLQDGVNVVTFPEGRTSAGDIVRPFPAPLFRLARSLGRPIIPAALHYADPALVWTGDAPFLPHYLEVAKRRSSAVSITYLPAISDEPSGLSKASAGKHAAEAARQAIAGALGARLEGAEP
jgi:1-acyl-sn-glycerol-3-phosphate acyltransferase